jgi:predicted transcriptional regulator
MINVVIPLTEEQYKRAAARASELGYSDSRAYLLAVVEDVLEDEEFIDVIAGIREGLEDIRAGRVYPANDLDALLDSGKFDS